MSFKFIAWQKYDPQNEYAFVTGACIHPVTGGTDGFKGAHGVIAMKDTPQSDGSVTTSYVGVLTIPVRRVDEVDGRRREPGRSKRQLRA